MTRERRPFDSSFKLKVVRMIKEQGMSSAQVSQTMNIGQTALRRRVEHYESELLCSVITVNDCIRNRVICRPLSLSRK